MMRQAFLQTNKAGQTLGKLQQPLSMNLVFDKQD